MTYPKKKLAIVMPVYKGVFFEETLRSIASQTDKRFTVYIGDDCSPDNLYDIVKLFRGEIDIVYDKFQENLGGRDLVGHWARCIAMTRGEEWIWLFSDDDLMDKDCVKSFYETLELNIGEEYLYHFNVRVIDESGDIIRENNKFPEMLSNVDFFKKRATNMIASFVVEYIFSRKVYTNMGGFERFDLAWGSDHATWIKFSSQCGIVTIGGGEVSWRQSDHNISPNTRDALLSKRKVVASAAYYLWVKEYLKKERISTFFYIKHFLNDNRVYNDVVSWRDMQKVVVSFIGEINGIYIFPAVVGMFIHRGMKKVKSSVERNKDYLYKKLLSSRKWGL